MACSRSSSTADAGSVDSGTALALADWRRRVADLYATVRTLPGAAGFEVWRRGRETLYREHAQSPVPGERRGTFEFRCFPYDPRLRTVATLVAAASPDHRDGDVPGMTRVGSLHFELLGAERELGAFWLDGYAGGLFVPVRDATSGTGTYGGGRYVLDTAKGADLGCEGEGVILDFNFAFSPSCAHDARWLCPLATQDSVLDISLEGGERA